MRLSLTISVVLFFLLNCAGPDTETFEFTTGDIDLDQTLSYVDVGITDLPDEFCIEAGENRYPAQSDKISMYQTRIWWNAEQTAGQTVEYTILREQDCGESSYGWTRTGDQSLQLQHEDKALLQYEHPVFDYENIEETKKPFHHVFSPVSDELITKGPGGLYSHHRGIFFGYNQVELRNNMMDFWHATDGERTEHEEVAKEFTGPVFGGHVSKINWKDQEGEVMLEEFRDVRAFRNSDSSYMVDFHTQLYAIAGLFSLGGDLQHAGIQFRAAQYVADNSESTRFIRPEEWAEYPADEELTEENWNNLPWDAMQFTIEDDTYTVVYMSHPSNPGRTKEMSERTYGRFGEFIPYQLSEGAPLGFRYRFWVIAGESPSVSEIDNEFQKYADLF